jgi:hypothetical protein
MLETSNALCALGNIKPEFSFEENTENTSMKTASAAQ